MKIVFVSNFMNHHQLPICNSLQQIDNIDFVFIASEPFSQNGVSKGYTDMNDRYPFIIKCYESTNVQAYAINLINEADVVICGAAPTQMIRQRIIDKKLTFIYCERPLKNGFEVWKYPYRWMKWHRTYPCNSNVYILCASAFTSYDYSRFGLFKNKCYKWGYFPKSIEYDINALLKEKTKNSILWSGRLIDWKHPDDVVCLGKMLRDNHYDFSIQIIGSGYMDEEIRNLVRRYGLEDCIALCDAVTPDELRRIMEKSAIYIQSSDRKEGWGAVLNESMNSGCVVVASHAIGAVPYLMKHKENGLVYHSGNVDELFEKVKYLLDNPQQQERLGKAAYETIVGEWSAEIAAERLINLSEHLLSGEKSPDLYQTGPCSKAEIIKDDWFYE